MDDHDTTDGLPNIDDVRNANVALIQNAAREQLPLGMPLPTVAMQAQIDVLRDWVTQAEAATAERFDLMVEVRINDYLTEMIAAARSAKLTAPLDPTMSLRLPPANN